MICLIIWSKVFLIKSLAIYFFLTQFWPLLLTEIKIKYDKVNNVPLAHPYYNLALFSMMVIFSLTWFTIFEINNVDKGKYLGTKVVTSDSTYTSDSFHFFIGKTENYFFIFNSREKEVTVIPNNEVKKFILKSQ